MPDEPEDEYHRQLRHDLRGAFHHMMLCVDLLSYDPDRDECLYLLGCLANAAEKADAAAAEMERE